jgi:hypothetical protein
VTYGNSQEICQLDDALALFFLKPIGAGALDILSTEDRIKRSKWLLEASRE